MGIAAIKSRIMNAANFSRFALSLGISVGLFFLIFQIWPSDIATSIEATTETVRVKLNGMYRWEVEKTSIVNMDALECPDRTVTVSLSDAELVLDKWLSADDSKGSRVKASTFSSVDNAVNLSCNSSKKVIRLQRLEFQMPRLSRFLVSGRVSIGSVPSSPRPSSNLALTKAEAISEARISVLRSLDRPLRTTYTAMHGDLITPVDENGEPVIVHIVLDMIDDPISVRVKGASTALMIERLGQTKPIFISMNPGFIKTLQSSDVVSAIILLSSFIGMYILRMKDPE